MNTPICKRKKGKTVQCTQFHCFRHLLGTVSEYNVNPRLALLPRTMALGSAVSDYAWKELVHIIFAFDTLLKWHNSQGWALGWDESQMAIVAKWVFQILKLSLVGLWCFISLVYKPSPRIWIQICLSLSSACSLVPQNNGLVWRQVLLSPSCI